MRNHILVVDDEPTFRRTISRFLAHRGFEVTTAANGRDALELALEHRFDAVLSDVQMPEMGGLELLPRLTAEYPDMPVTLMSGSTVVSGSGEALARGAFEFLPKPLNLERLLTVMRRAVEARRRDVHNPQRLCLADSV